MLNRYLRAFTLIELLVVVTIIVVLLALLMPALDKAIYQAELAVCGANLHGVSAGALAYAFESKRQYPYRPGVHNRAYRAIMLSANGSVSTSAPYYDDRPTIKNHIALKLLACPLTGKIDLDIKPGERSAPGYQEPTKDAAVGDMTWYFSTYNLWFGWKYGYGSSPKYPGMQKLGDRWTWADRSFRWLASDLDELLGDRPQATATHPDEDGVMSNVVAQDLEPAATDAVNTAIGRRITYSAWYTPNGTGKRGLIDTNFASDDGAVVRFTRVKVRDERMTEVPDFNNGDNPAWMVHLPRE